MLPPLLRLLRLLRPSWLQSRPCLPLGCRKRITSIPTSLKQTALTILSSTARATRTFPLHRSRSPLPPTESLLPGTTESRGFLTYLQALTVNRMCGSLRRRHRNSLSIAKSARCPRPLHTRCACIHPPSPQRSALVL